MPQPNYAAIRERKRAKARAQAEADLFGFKIKSGKFRGRFAPGQLSPEDVDFLNDPRNAEFKEQYIKDFMGMRKGGVKNLSGRLLDRRGQLLAQDFFAANPRPSLNAQDIQNMITQQRGATLTGLPTVEGFGQGVLPMLQGGFQAPMSPPVFGQGGGMFAGAPQISQGVLGNLATQGMGQIGAGQTMNPTIFRGKV